MSRFTVRTLCSGGFGGLRQLGTDVFGAAGADVFESLRPTHERPGLLPGSAVAA
jgi:hypothetical protein